MSAPATGEPRSVGRRRQLDRRHGGVREPGEATPVVVERQPEHPAEDEPDERRVRHDEDGTGGTGDSGELGDGVEPSCDRHLPQFAARKRRRGRRRDECRELLGKELRHLGTRAALT